MKTRKYLLDQYRKEYANRLNGVDRPKMFKEVAAILNKHWCKTVLDYGCGGRMFLVHHLNRAGFAAVGYDPGHRHCEVYPAGLRYDAVVSTDVFEHFTKGSLLHEVNLILELEPRVIYLNIATSLSRQVLPDGTPAHTLVRPPNWWRRRLVELFSEYEVEIFRKNKQVQPETITVVLKK